MSIVLITNNHDAYPHLTKSHNLSNALITDNDTIIIKDCNMPYKDIMYYLAMCYQKRKKIIYINSQLVQPLVYIMELMGGVIYNDLGLLDDFDTLQFIIDSNGTSGMEIKTLTDDMKKVTRAINFLTSGTEEEKLEFVKSPKLLGELLTSVNILEDKVIKNASKDNTMRNFVLDIVKTSITYEETIRQLRGEISDLLNKVEKVDKDTRSNSLFAYPPYKVDYPTKKVCYVVEQTPCKYITTFLMYYTDYVNVYLQKKARMLIILPRLTNVVKKYSDFPKLDDTNAKTVLDQTTKRVFVTYEPKKSVLDDFLKDIQYDLFVVLDLTHSGEILKGVNVKTYSAIAGVSDARRFAVNTKYTFTSFFRIADSIGLNKIAQFPQQSESNKKAFYYKAYSEIYARLDRDLNIGG